MKKLIGNFRAYKGTVLIILCLLIGQAYCDMSLPQLTSEIIDTGIQNSGIEHILPSEIIADDYQEAQMFMTAEEKTDFQSVYENSEEDNIYYLNASNETLETLDEELLEPIVLTYFVRQMKSGEMKVEDSGQYAAMAQMTPEQLRETMPQMIDKTGAQTVKAMGINYARICLADADVDMEQIRSDYLWSCGFKMLILTAAMFLIAAVVSVISSRTGAMIGRDLRTKVFSNVMSYSNREMDSFQTSSLITRATNDIQQVQMVSTMILRMVLFAPVMAVWGIIKVYQTKAHMSFVIIASVLIMISFISLLMVIALPKFRIMQKLIDRLNGVSREMLTGLSVIRAFGREQVAEDRFRSANGDLRRNQLFVNRVMTFMGPVMMMIMTGTSVVITWVAAHRIEDGTLQVGAMTAFITYAMMIIMSFMILTAMSVILPRAGVAAERIDEVVGTKTSIVDRDNAVELTDCKGLVEFKDVHFRYPDADDDVIEGISFTAKVGETTAIIGSTGSGKSTLINLIPRFFDVTSGSIEIDGRDIRDYSLSSLRRAIGYVPQKGILFSGTIDSNIGFGLENEDEEAVKKAAEIAQAADFIAEKEGGYESHIAQGGSNVSGGQKQRLSIARALAKKPAILIFDDSFSALDMKTDANLRRALSENAHNATKLIVAQRVGTILHADQIIVLDDGKIVGKGTHDELMKSCDVYIQIAKSQLSNKDIEEVC